LIWLIIRKKTGLVKDAVTKKWDEVNITKIENIIDDIKQSQKEKLSMEDQNGMLDILKAKDQYVLEMENSLYSSWAFGRVKITGKNSGKI
jgi:uncharacterized membrane-anchored protein YitT (DUF2179 family)